MEGVVRYYGIIVENFDDLQDKIIGSYAVEKVRGDLNGI